MCGEKHCTSTPIALVSGSPPRMRGKGNESAVGLVVQRITPACAGKSCPPQAPTFTRQDHPRVCGEKDKAAEKAQHLRGSPPHVRGKVSHRVHHKVHDGITPACAGKSCPPQAPTFTRQDHPRVCGEKDKAAEKAQHLRGSPPHVRGKVSHRVHHKVHDGITPAYAGKSPLSESTSE